MLPAVTPSPTAISTCVSTVYDTNTNVKVHKPDCNLEDHTNHTKVGSVVGQLFTWGRGTSGQLGQRDFLYPRNSECCAIPYPVPGMTHITSVACGGLEEGFTVAADNQGRVFTFGKDLFGRLGHGSQGRSSSCVVEPTRVLSLGSIVVISVAAGAEHAAALTDDGHVWSWGRNVGGCLGRGTLGSRSEKVVSRTLTVGISNDQANDSDESLPALVHDVGHGRSSWIETHYGRLSKKEKETNKFNNRESKRSMLAHVVQISCEYHYSGALLSDGRLVMWGTNSYGQLGVGDQVDRSLPNQVSGLTSIVNFDLGTRHCAAITKIGRLYMWGDNTHGGLGLGDHHQRLVPTHVTGNNLDVQVVVRVACSRTQGWQAAGGGAGHQSVVRIQKGKKELNQVKEKEKTKKKNKKNKSQKQQKQKTHANARKDGIECISYSGSEGGHTCVLTKAGAMYTFGTAHNGVLANLGRKTNAMLERWDQDTPYLVGSELSDERLLQNSLVPHVPLSPFACWPKYDTCGPFSEIATSHDHCFALNNQGELWGWGNGTDGRIGCERYLNMSGERRNGKTGGLKPPSVDRCKCILMGPHRVGVARQAYWPGGDALKDFHVTMIATGQNFAACVAVPKLIQPVQIPAFLPKNSPRGHWIPVGERVGYNDVTPPVKFNFTP